MALTRTWRMHAYPTRAGYIISVQHSSTWVCLGDFFFPFFLSIFRIPIGELASWHRVLFRVTLDWDSRTSSELIIGCFSLFTFSSSLLESQLEAVALHSPSTRLRLCVYNTQGRRLRLGIIDRWYQLQHQRPIEDRSAGVLVIRHDLEFVETER